MFTSDLEKWGFDGFLNNIPCKMFISHLFGSNCMLNLHCVTPTWSFTCLLHITLINFFFFKGPYLSEWKSANIEDFVFFVVAFLYACESWTITAELQRRIWAMEIRCYHKTLHISCKGHVTNKEICAKIQQAIRPHKHLLTIVKRHKLKWYGHLSHSSDLAKTILQGTVEGRRGQGRQKKRWEDNIREWTGLEFGKSQRAVENREKRKKLVVKLFVVP